MLVLILLLVGCSSSTPSSSGPVTQEREEREEPDQRETARESPETDGEGLCLPLVNGCGCAYVCAQAVQRGEGDRWMVSHDYQDSRLDEAAIERRCFDESGVSSPDTDAPPVGTVCKDVFYDLSPCGGECAPTTEFLNCHLVGHSCRP